MCNLIARLECRGFDWMGGILTKRYFYAQNVWGLEMGGLGLVDSESGKRKGYLEDKVVGAR